MFVVVVLLVDVDVASKWMLAVAVAVVRLSMTRLNGSMNAVMARIVVREGEISDFDHLFALVSHAVAVVVVVVVVVGVGVSWRRSIRGRREEGRRRRRESWRRRDWFKIIHNYSHERDGKVTVA